MSPASQKRASKAYREGLARRGVARFEVMGLENDKALIRDLARKLAEPGADAERLRREVTCAVKGPEGPKGGVLAALRRSPLDLLDLTAERPSDDERALRF